MSELNRKLLAALNEYNEIADEDAKSGVEVLTDGNRIIIDVMDWGDERLARTLIGDVAEELVGVENVEWQNEGRVPDGFEKVKSVDKAKEPYYFATVDETDFSHRPNKSTEYRGAIGKGGGIVDYCNHIHYSREAALKCAEKMLKEGKASGKYKSHDGHDVVQPRDDSTSEYCVDCQEKVDKGLPELYRLLAAFHKDSEEELIWTQIHDELISLGAPRLAQEFLHGTDVARSHFAYAIEHNRPDYYAGETRNAELRRILGKSLVQKAIVAVDLHGTLGTKNEGNGDTYPYDPADYTPQEGAADALKQLRADGHQVVIWTCWDKENARLWLEKHGFPYDYINQEGVEEFKHEGSDSPKVDADAYVDDKAVPHTGDWEETLRLLEPKLNKSYVRIKSRPLDLQQFATRVNAFAQHAPASEKFGDHKTYISWVRDKVGVSPAEFNKLLEQARIAGLVQLARADLVSEMDPKKVRDSETRQGIAEFHFIVKTIDKGKGEPCKRGESAARTGCIPRGDKPTKPREQSNLVQMDPSLWGGSFDVGQTGSTFNVTTDMGADYDGGRGSNEIGTTVTQPSEPVAGESERAGNSGSNQEQEDDLVPVSETTPKRLPRSVGRVTDKIDKMSKLLKKRGAEHVADWLDNLKKQIEEMGPEAALEALGAEKGEGEKVQYAGHADIEPGDFAQRYLSLCGITLMPNAWEVDPDKKIVSVVAPSKPDDPEAVVISRGRAEDVMPSLPVLKNKLEEAKHLPGLETTEDLGKLMGGNLGDPVPQLTEEVIKKLDSKYGPGQWIIKPYSDHAFQGYGIFFPERAQYLKTEAQSIIWAANDGLKQSGYSLARDDSGNISGIVNSKGREYPFKSEQYKRLPDHVRIYGDMTEKVAPNEHGAKLPEGSFMAQPAFAALGQTGLDRAKGSAYAPNEGRIHITTKNGKAEIIPYSTIFKGSGWSDALPVVFQDEHTKQLAESALEAINALPESERQGQLYAPDLILTKNGYRVVEANPSNEAGGSGPLQWNPFIMDSYVSHVTGKDPYYIKFVRNLLKKKKSLILKCDLESQRHTKCDQGPNKGKPGPCPKEGVTSSDPNKQSSGKPDKKPATNAFQVINDYKKQKPTMENTLNLLRSLQKMDPKARKEALAKGDIKVPRSILTKIRAKAEAAKNPGTTDWVKKPNKSLPDGSRPPLTTDQKDALNWYTGDNYVDFNDKLRSCK